jgi:hypothetical protein
LTRYSRHTDKSKELNMVMRFDDTGFSAVRCSKKLRRADSQRRTQHADPQAASSSGQQSADKPGSDQSLSLE